MTTPITTRLMGRTMVDTISDTKVVGDVAERSRRAFSKVEFGVLLAQYAFGSQGGAIGTILSGVFIPAGAIVTRIWTVTKTAKSGSGTLTAYSGSNSLGAITGLGVNAVATAPAGTVLAAAEEIKFVISGNTVTAGAVDVYVEYLPGDGA